MSISRRGFLISTGAAVAARGVPMIAVRQRRILKLVWDKKLQMMRAVERIVPF